MVSHPATSPPPLVGVGALDGAPDLTIIRADIRQASRIQRHARLAASAAIIIIIIKKSVTKSKRA